MSPKMAMFAMSSGHFSSMLLPQIAWLVVHLKHHQQLHLRGLWIIHKPFELQLTILDPDDQGLMGFYCSSKFFSMCATLCPYWCAFLVTFAEYPPRTGYQSGVEPQTSRKGCQRAGGLHQNWAHPRGSAKAVWASFWFQWSPGQQGEFFQSHRSLSTTHPRLCSNHNVSSIVWAES